MDFSFLNFLQPLFNVGKEVGGFGLGALDLLGKIGGVYGNIQHLMFPPDRPQYPRDMAGTMTPPMPMPTPAQGGNPTPDPVAIARLRAMQRKQMQERGIYSGGAIADEAVTDPYMMLQKGGQQVGNPMNIQAGTAAQTQAGPYDTYSMYGYGA